MEEKKKRALKTTRQQYCLFLEELEANEAFRTNKFSPKDPEIIEKSWETLVISLNSTGGPQKSVAQWKRVFTDWKSSVKKRARSLKICQVQTGGGPPEKPLTDLEKKLIEIIGSVVIHGMEEVLEIGIPTEDVNTVTKEKKEIPDIPATPSCSSSVLASNCNQHMLEIPTPIKRKNNTMLSSLSTMLTEAKNTDNNVYDVLKSIDNNLNKLVKLKEREINFKYLKLKQNQINCNKSEDE